MRKPRLNENTIAKLEIYGETKSGKYYYRLIDFLEEDGYCETILERTDLKTGDAREFNWEKYTKEA